jgi:DNA-binding beta-propeller fold protein YncE
VSEYTNGTILKIAPDRSSSVFATDPTVVVNGSGIAPGINGIAFDQNGDLFVTEENLQRIREYAPDGSSAIVASGFQSPYDVKLDAAGNLYVSDIGAGTIDKFSPTGEGLFSSFQGGVFASIHDGVGIAFDQSGNLFTAGIYPGDTTKDYSLLEVTPDGTVTKFADLGDVGPHNVIVEPVPEPGAGLLLGWAAALVCGRQRRRRASIVRRAAFHAVSS